MAGQISPTGIRFVENAIFEYLRSIPTSKEQEDRYRGLNSTVKSASTAELRKIAKRCTQNILANTDSLNALSHLDDDDLICEALEQAINDVD